MNTYKIITDSTCDLPIDIIEKLDVEVIPMNYSIDGEEYVFEIKEGSDKDTIKFYERIKNSMASTSQININTYIETFEKYLKQEKDVIYIGFSSGLSGTYQTSLLAKDMLLEKYEDRKIICVDSKAASLGEGLLVYMAGEKRNKGYTINGLDNWIEENKDSIAHYFTVEDLKYLYNGGRISKMDMILGSALNVNIMMRVDKNGLLKPIEKVRGRKKALKQLVASMKEKIKNPEEQIIFVGHGNDLEAGKLVKELVEKEIKPKKVILGFMGPIVGSHTGEGIVSVFFFGKK